MPSLRSEERRDQFIYLTDTHQKNVVSVAIYSNSWEVGLLTHKVRYMLRRSIPLTLKFHDSTATVSVPINAAIQSRLFSTAPHWLVPRVLIGSSQSTPPLHRLASLLDLFQSQPADLVRCCFPTSLTLSFFCISWGVAIAYLSILSMFQKKKMEGKCCNPGTTGQV